VGSVSEESEVIVWLERLTEENMGVAGAQLIEGVHAGRGRALVLTLTFWRSAETLFRPISLRESYNSIY